MKAVVAAFNQEKALVGAFSVIVKTSCGTDGSICGTSLVTHMNHAPSTAWAAEKDQQEPHGPWSFTAVTAPFALQSMLSGTCSSASKRSIRRFVITEKAPTRAFSWLKATTTAFPFKTLLRHYAKQALTPRSLNVKLGPQRNYHEGQAAIRPYANRMEL